MNMLLNSVTYNSLLIIILASCGAKGTIPNNRHFSSLYFLISFPIPAEDYSWAQTKDTVKIISYKDYIIYGLPKSHTDVEMTDTGQRIKTAFIWYMYFVTKKEYSTGILFDTVQKLETEQIVDSFVAGYGIYKFPENFNASIKNKDFVGEQWLSENKLVCRYATRFKPDDSYTDSILVYFERVFPQTNYSISPEMERQKKMKLTYVRNLFIGNSAAVDPYARSKRELSFGIMPGKVEDEKFLLNLIDRFEKVNKTQRK